MDESLHNLPPEERKKALQELREKKRREFEELERDREEELRALEEEERSLEDAAEEEVRDREDRRKALEEELDALESEEESLEEVVRQERQRGSSEEGSYRIPQEEQSYTPAQTIMEDLQQLQYTSEWGSREQELYRERKEDLEQAQQYRGTLADEITSQLDTAASILDRLGYKR